jgi:Zn finger protein HypA/HybF involved in hydrogenase expression
MAVIDTVDEYLDSRSADNEPGPDGRGAADPKVTRIALQVGKRSSYLPSYIREIWPFAVNDSPLAGAVLEIEDIEGRDFLIKEIEIEE